MSKAILVYFRERIDYSDQIYRKLKTICENLQPDNFQANPPQLWKNGTTFYGITNPVDSVIKTKSSVLLGKLYVSTRPTTSFW